MSKYHECCAPNDEGANASYLGEAIDATEPHARLRHFCSAQHTDSALYPTIGYIERAAGFMRDDTVLVA
jgi:hypothetical protein